MKRVTFLFLILLFDTLPLLSSAEIVIEGTVAMPPPKPVSAAYARYAQKAGTVATPSPAVAVVYLEGTFPSGKTSVAGPVVVQQQGYQFSPGVLAVQKGASVEFPNKDDDYHHVFSYSKAKEFDLGRYRKDEKAPAVAFDKPGLVKVGCEIHDHMRAVVLVLDTPYFKSTETNGAYRLVINEALTGKYLLKAWIDEKNVREQSVELKDGAKLQVNFPGK